MSVVKHIFFDELRYWHRSRLAATVILIGTLLTIASVLVNTVTMRETAHHREQLQQASETRFLDQPDRHPHRMVHYGHYVFRNLVPLSVLEPGVDAYTGTAIFLEGHRQNSAMFADQKQSSGLTQFSSLSPTFVLQVIAPLLLIIVGYASITREREAGTLNMMMVQGVKKWQLLQGKFFALMSCGLLILLPLLIASIWASTIGEAPMISLGFIMGYVLYIFIWSLLVICVSTLSHQSAVSVVSLIALWVVFCILVPRISSTSAAMVVPSSGKLETDFAMLKEKNKLGDGHNATDPAFAQLKAQLLAKYQVDDVAELPLNFRGLIAQQSEQQLTDVLNQFAEKRMQQEVDQAHIARQFGWLSPTMAMRTFSMIMAGTNLENHHRFLREAEAVRFGFVQSLNKLHEEEVDYHADAKKYHDADTNQAARVDASNWNVLNQFSFQPESATKRLQQSVIAALQLVFWCLFSMVLMAYASRRIE